MQVSSAWGPVTEDEDALCKPCSIRQAAFSWPLRALKETVLPHLHPAGQLNGRQNQGMAVHHHISSWVETRELTGGESCSSESDTGGVFIFSNISFKKNFTYLIICATHCSMCDLSFLTRDEPGTLHWEVEPFFYFCILAALGFHDCVRFSPVVVSGGLASCGAHASHCGGFSSCEAQAVGRTDLGSCVLWTLSRPRIEPIVPALAGGLSHWTPGKSPQLGESSALLLCARGSRACYFYRHSAALRWEEQSHLLSGKILMKLKQDRVHRPWRKYPASYTPLCFPSHGKPLQSERAVSLLAAWARDLWVAQ